MNNTLMFSSKTDKHETPQFLFDLLDKTFRFTTDVCATPSSAKCEHYYTEEEDGLAQEWTGTCWMNPPCGREIGKWLKKAYESSLNGATVVCLVPARTDTKWWWDYVTNGVAVFIKGRLTFGDSTSGAPFPSAIVVFSHSKFPAGGSSRHWDPKTDTWKNDEIN